MDRIRANGALLVGLQEPGTPPRRREALLQCPIEASDVADRDLRSTPVRRLVFALAGLRHVMPSTNEARLARAVLAVRHRLRGLRDRSICSRNQVTTHRTALRRKSL